MCFAFLVCRFIPFNFWKYLIIKTIIQIEHLTRIQRVLRMEQGHCLLVGVGGSGKQSLTKLASYAAGCDVFEITLSRGYDENNFREDLRVG